MRVSLQAEANSPRAVFASNKTALSSDLGSQHPQVNSAGPSDAESDKGKGTGCFSLN